MEEMKTSRFKKKSTIGCVVAIRGAESFDRYTVLKQGDYDTGRYGTQYDCAVYSPFMDLSTEDLWRTVALLGLDSNEIYSMYWDAGVPLVKQRIGSPINSHSGDAVKLYKVLNPGTYSKMVGRINNLDFTSAYGGVFNTGFKYIKLEQPKPFYDGIVNSQSLADALNELKVDYTKRLSNVAVDSDDAKTVYNAGLVPVKLGDNIRLRRILPDFARSMAADACEKRGDTDAAERYRANVPKKKEWYDYLVQLVNEAEPMYQKSWMPKFVTSMKHWAKTGSVVNEATVIAMRVLSNRVDKTFGADQYDYEEYVDWAIGGYADITRMPIIKFFRYNQDCAENLTRAYIDDMLERWDDGGRSEFEANRYLLDIMLNGNIVPGMGPAVWYKNAPSAKEIHMCVFQGVTYGNGDKMTGNGEKVEEWLMAAGSEHPDKDGPSGFPVNIDENSLGIGSGRMGCGGVYGPSDEDYDINVGWTDSNGKPCWKTGAGQIVGESWLKDTLKRFSDRFWHDEVKQSANWKRAVITCLRNDIKGTYMGFGQSSEEKLIRANALAMFAENEAERQKKIKEFETLKKKIEKEKRDAADELRLALGQNS